MKHIAPIEKDKYSVLQDWVMQLTMRQQGVLCTAIRGPDGVPKEDASKAIHRSIRGVVMNCARYKAPMVFNSTLNGDSFMRTDLFAEPELWDDTVNTFFANADRYYMHYIMHVLHACQIIGVYHPDQRFARPFQQFYLEGVRRFHMEPESISTLDNRLRDGRREEYDE